MFQSHTVADPGLATPVIGAGAWRLVVLGVVLWSIGPIMVHAGAPYGMMSPDASVVLFVATLPLVWLTVRLVRRVAAAGMGVVEAVTLALAPAVLLDSVVLTWAPTIYSAVESERRAAAGWLLWFIATSLALAFWQASRQRGSR